MPVDLYLSRTTVSKNDIKTAIVTGAHEYDVVNFHHLSRELPGLDCYVQNLEDFATDPNDGWQRYGAVVFFNYHQPTPGTLGTDVDNAVKGALEALISGDKGIVLLHHAILCYPGWQPWEQLSGLDQRGGVNAAVDQRLRIEITDGEHPITRGLEPWEMIDEPYEAVDAGPGSQVLLTTNYPRSMKTIGWTRERSNGRTFCFQSGHDNQTWANTQFRTVLERGVKWTAREL